MKKIMTPRNIFRLLVADVILCFGGAAFIATTDIWWLAPVYGLGGIFYGLLALDYRKRLRNE